jgi:hypothetical protein
MSGFRERFLAQVRSETKPDATEQTGRDTETPESRAKAFDQGDLETELLDTVETLRQMPLDLPQLLG